jgi:hypothetical protein
VRLCSGQEAVMDWTHWTLEWLKVAGIWLSTFAIYYLCWVRYPPRASTPSALDALPRTPKPRKEM